MKFLMRFGGMICVTWNQGKAVTHHPSCTWSSWLSSLRLNLCRSCFLLQETVGQMILFLTLTNLVCHPSHVGNTHLITFEHKGDFKTVFKLRFVEGTWEYLYKLLTKAPWSKSILCYFTGRGPLRGQALKIHSGSHEASKDCDLRA